MTTTSDTNPTKPTTNCTTTPPSKPTRGSFLKDATYAVLMGGLMSLIPLAIIYVFVAFSPYRRDGILVNIPEVISRANATKFIADAEAVNPEGLNMLHNATHITCVTDIDEDVFQDIVDLSISPALRNAFKIPSSKFHAHPRDLYLVKVDESSDPYDEYLAFKDYTAAFRYEILLNEQFTGGKIDLRLHDQPLSAEVGELIAYPNLVKRTSQPVKAGTQYKLVGFVGYFTGYFSIPYGKFLSCLQHITDNTFVINNLRAASEAAGKETCDEGDDTCEAPFAHVERFTHREKQCTFFYRLAAEKFADRFVEQMTTGPFYIFTTAVAIAANIVLVYIGMRQMFL